MNNAIFQLIGLIIFCIVNLHLKNVIDKNKNFDGILWGIITGIAGGIIWDILAYFSVKSFMKNLSRRTKNNGILTQSMRNTMQEYLIGIIIGTVIGFGIGFLIRLMGIHL